MAIRPTIRLINANWRDQTETGGRFLFCSLREPSREEEETKRAIPEGSGRFPATRRVNMENRPGFWRKEEEKCERERDVYVYIYIYVPFVPGVGLREHRRCGRRPAFSPAEFPFAPTRPPPRSFSPRIAGCPRASRPTPSSSASFSSSSRPSAPSAS